MPANLSLLPWCCPTFARSRSLTTSLLLGVLLCAPAAWPSPAAAVPAYSTFDATGPQQLQDCINTHQTNSSRITTFNETIQQDLPSTVHIAQVGAALD